MHAMRTDSAAHSLENTEPVPSAAESPAWYLRIFQNVRALLNSVRLRRRVRSLHICESLPLGEKRLIAIVQFEGRRFLIGATSQSISLLDRLDSAEPSAKPDRSQEAFRLSGVN